MEDLCGGNGKDLRCEETEGEGTLTGNGLEGEGLVITDCRVWVRSLEKR